MKGGWKNVPVSTMLLTYCWAEKIQILSGTECSDCSNASFTWCGFERSLVTVYLLTLEKTPDYITGKECLWHRETTPYLRGLTGFHGFAIPTEYGFNESDSIWPLNTAHETQTHFLRPLKIQKRSVSLSRLYTDVGKNLSQHIKTWLELNDM